MVTVMKGKGYEQFKHQNAKRWLVNRYRTVFGIWRQFDLDDAADFLNEKARDLGLYSFDDLPKLDLMCVMADARRHPDCTKGNSRSVNPPQRDKTLQEVIDWCTARANELIEDTNGDYYAQFCQVDALTWVINHCREMLGYNGSMPLEAPHQSEGAQHDGDGR